MPSANTPVPASASVSVPVLDDAAMAKFEKTAIEFGLLGIAWSLAATIATPVCAAHGALRNDSAGWGFLWGVYGGFLPPVALVHALVNGFGEPKSLDPQREMQRARLQNPRAILAGASKPAGLARNPHSVL